MRGDFVYISVPAGTPIGLHLGVIQSPNGRYPVSVDAVKQCIRGTFLSLSNKVSGRDGASPLTLLKLYRTSVLPRALFGCEMWNIILQTDMQQLEIAHHFCRNVAQGLPALTRSDMTMGLHGITRVEAYIDKQKLRFLGTLCRTPSDDIVCKLFTHRLFQYKSCNFHKIWICTGYLHYFEQVWSHKLHRTFHK